MPRWIPKAIWSGEDAIIIGGGPSLHGFDFSRLAGRNVIGCNDAFRLGSSIVKFNLFGDHTYFQRAKWELEKSDVPLVSCSPTLARVSIPWVYQMDRQKEGLCTTGGALGWNGSTGAAAVSLALTLGSRLIYLLGFDMCRASSNGRSHWHDHSKKPIESSTFRRHIDGFGMVYRGMKKFPDSDLINVTNGGSNLPHFRRMTFDNFNFLFPLPKP